MDSNGHATATISRRLRPSITAGLIVVVIFVVGLVVWSRLAPLASAAIAPGVVSVESQRKTVQHLEGGIVAEILVAESDKVKAGQIIVRLDQTRARASLERLLTRYYAALARAARLSAERDGRQDVQFGDKLEKANFSTDVNEMLRGETNIFLARQDALRGQANILQQRIAQLSEEIVGLEGQSDAEMTQLELVAQEIDGLKALVRKKLSGKQRLLELQREQAQIAGNRSRHVSAIARVKQNIAEERVKILELSTSRVNEVVEALREVQTLVFDLEERMRTEQDVLKRTEIRAPLAGTVVNLQVHTVGGVIRPGDPLLDIVPSDERLVIDADVKPDDIDSVRPGLAAQVVLTAFDRRNVPPFEGTVVSVSADRLVDPQTGAPYFRARVQLPEQTAAAHKGLVISPGMQAEVLIVTGARTMMDYMLRPLARGINRSLREN
jgi:membrane fusion protein, epimerase transport system